jgi:hypothetical protein
MNEAPDPREALASIQSTREGMTERMTHPVGYDLVCAAICGLMVASQGLQKPWSLVALLVAMAALGGCVHWWKSRFGWWVNGYAPKRAGRVAYGMAVMLLVLIGVTMWGRGAGILWMPLATGSAAFVLSILGGRLWMRVWKRELAEADG